METTTHYGLQKPDPNDTYNKATDNSNMDAIDDQMYQNAQNGIPYGVDSSAAANTITANVTPAPTAYVDGYSVRVKVANTTTGATTLNLDSLGAVAVKNADGTAVGAGDLQAGIPRIFTYVGGASPAFIASGSGGLSGSGNATAADVLAPNTFTSASGKAQEGTMPNNGALGTITPGTAAKAIPSGYTTGGQVAGDANLVSSNIKSGTSIFGVAGKASVVDTGDATANAGQILSGDTAYVNGSKITGTIPSQGATTITPGTASKTAITAGTYASGAATVAGDANLVTGNIKAGVSIFGVAGKSSVVDTGDATATAAQILTGQSAYVNGAKVAGSMPNEGAVTLQPSGTGTVAIPAGYHNGSGEVAQVSVPAADVLSGTTIAGVAGSMPNNGALGTITPGTAAKAIAAGYTSGGQVAGDPNLVATNILSGKSIFGVNGSVNPAYYASGSLAQDSSGYYKVSGLSFTPRVIIINIGGNSWSSSLVVYSSDVSTTIYWDQGNTRNVNYNNGLGSGAGYVQNGGFQLFVGGGGTGYWEAYA